MASGLTPNLKAGLPCDGVLDTGSAVRKQFADTPCKALDVVVVDCETPLGLALTTARTCIVIGQAVHFGPQQSRLFDQNALSLVPAPSTAPLEDNRGKRGVPARTTGQRGIPGRKEDEVIEVGAGEAQSATFPDEHNPRMAPQALPTLVACGFAAGDEYFQIRLFAHRRARQHADTITADGGSRQPLSTR